MSKDTADFIFRPMFNPAQAVSHYSIGILCLKYPAKPGQGKFVDQKAIEKYGPALFQTVENIYTRDVWRTGKEAHVKVLWNEDGSPKLVVLKRSIILDPGVN